MININLELADNGIVKTIIDDNYNGANHSFESKIVYPISNINDSIDFISELIGDLNLPVGNINARENLNMDIQWGETYKPTKIELLEKIQNLKDQLQVLEVELEVNYKNDKDQPLLQH